MIEYERLKLFFSITVGLTFDLESVPEDEKPMAAMAALEARSRRLAARGLRMGVSDVLEVLATKDHETLARISSALETAGAPSIATVSAAFGKRLAKVIKAGVIRTEEEFYAIRNLADSPEMEDEVRARLQLMLDTFEFGPATQPRH